MGEGGTPVGSSRNLRSGSNDKGSGGNLTNDQENVGFFKVLQAAKSKNDAQIEILKYRPMKTVKSVCDEEEQAAMAATFDVSTDGRDAAMAAAGDDDEEETTMQQFD